MHITAPGKKRLYQFIKEVEALQENALMASYNRLIKKLQIYATSKSEVAMDVANAKAAQLAIKILEKNPKLSADALLEKVEKLINNNRSFVRLKSFLEGAKIDYTLKQIDAALRMAQSLVGLPKFLFTMRFIKNLKNYNADYNIINNGRGSWAPAIANEYGISLSNLMLALFRDFRDNLSDYLDLKDGKVNISIFGKSIFCDDLKRIVGSAVEQIEGFQAFFEYLLIDHKSGREALLEELENITSSAESAGESKKGFEAIRLFIEKIMGLQSRYLDLHMFTQGNDPVLLCHNDFGGSNGYASNAFDSVLRFIFKKSTHDGTNYFNLFRDLIKRCCDTTFECQITSVIQGFKEKAQRLVGDEDKAESSVVEGDPIEDESAEFKKNIIKRLLVQIDINSPKCEAWQSISNLEQDGLFLMLGYLGKLPFSRPKEPSAEDNAYYDGFVKALGDYINPTSFGNQYVSDWVKVFNAIDSTELDAYKKYMRLGREIKLTFKQELIKSPSEWLCKIIACVEVSILNHSNESQQRAVTLGRTGDLLQDLFAKLLVLLKESRLRGDPTFLYKFNLMEQTFLCQAQTEKSLLHLNFSDEGDQSKKLSPQNMQSTTVSNNPLGVFCRGLGVGKKTKATVETPKMMVSQCYPGSG